MTSVVEICNNALIKLDAPTITSLSDNTKSAIACNLMYPQIRDDMLTAHPWNFAIEQASLSQLVAAPTFEFDYKYQLPADCLRVLKAVDSSEVQIQFKIKGRQLHTDETTVDIEYIKQVTDSTQFSAQFIDVLATRLAAEIGYSMAGGTAKSDSLMNLYGLKLREAKRRDGQEGTPDKIQTNTWIDSRN
jgi:hypothetical protein